MSFKNLSAGFLANHMARLFAKGLQRRIKPLGLAPAQFMTLLELWDNDGISQRDLIQRLDVEQATIANTLLRMERDGLIERRLHPDDGRSQSIHLTAKAIGLREPASREAQAQNEAALSGMSEEERLAFLDLMRRAIAAMQSG